MKKLFFIPIVALSVFAFSCGTTNSVKTNSDSTKQEVSMKSKIEGEWKLVKMISSGVEQNVFESNLSVSKNGDLYSFSGNSGVNQFNGNVLISQNGDIKNQPEYLSTKMAGPEELMLFEDSFLQILSFATKINVGTQLEIIDVQSESKLIFGK